MTQLKDFQVVSLLSREQGYTTVLKVKRLQDQKDYAIKKIKLLDMSQQRKEAVLNEIHILASLRHPNVIEFKEVFVDASSHSLCIVMEYADNGDLEQKLSWLKKNKTLLPENEIWNIFIQILNGFKKLHEFKIVHRDIGCSNILLFKNGTVKIGDFSDSKKMTKGQMLTTQQGSPQFSGPEVWRQDPYNEKADMWSLGCLLYELATLTVPFESKDFDSMYRIIQKGQYKSIPSHFSKELNIVIKNLLSVNSILRPNCEQILTLRPIINRVSEDFLREGLMDGEEQLQQNEVILQQRQQLPQRNYKSVAFRILSRNQFIQNNQRENVSENLVNESLRSFLPPIGKSSNDNYSSDGQSLLEFASQKDKEFLKSNKQSHSSLYSKIQKKKKIKKNNDIEHVTEQVEDESKLDTGELSKNINIDNNKKIPLKLPGISEKNQIQQIIPKQVQQQQQQTKVVVKKVKKKKKIVKQVENQETNELIKQEENLESEEKIQKID